MIHSLHVSYKNISSFSLSFPFSSRPKFQRAFWSQYVYSVFFSLDFLASPSIFFPSFYYSSRWQLDESPPRRQRSPQRLRRQLGFLSQGIGMFESRFQRVLSTLDHFLRSSLIRLSLLLKWILLPTCLCRRLS
jgi:hypothetical protein